MLRLFVDVLIISPDLKASLCVFSGVSMNER